jgi:hypothetical protein
LNNWYLEHQNYPYATKEQKNELATSTSLSEQQISRWLSNARQKRSQQGLKSRKINVKEESLDNSFQSSVGSSR